MTQTNRKSQKNAILQYLLTGHSLTTNEAIELFGCTKLPTRISEFREEGYNIAGETREGKTRFGTPTRYKTYKIVK